MAPRQRGSYRSGGWPEWLSAVFHMLGPAPCRQAASTPPPMSQLCEGSVEIDGAGRAGYRTPCGTEAARLP